MEPGMSEQSSVKPDHPTGRRSIFWPLALVLIGVFFLLSNLGMLDANFGSLLATYWPAIFIIGALDDIYKRENFVGAALGLGLGTALILGNLGWLPWNAFGLLLRLWPVFLVAWGIGLLVKGRPGWATGLGALLVVLVMGGILWLGMSQLPRVTRQTETVSMALPAEAEEATFNIEAPVGKIILSGPAAAGQLIDGEIGLLQGLKLQDHPLNTTGTSTSCTLRMEGHAAILPSTGSLSQPEWDLKITDALPVTINSGLAVGEQLLDLGGLQVDSLNVQIAVGQIVITLPETDGFSGHIEGAVGEIVIRVPAGAHVRIRNRSALAPVFAPADFQRTQGLIESPDQTGELIELEIAQAVGLIRIEVVR